MANSNKKLIQAIKECLRFNEDLYDEDEINYLRGKLKEAQERQEQRKQKNKAKGFGV